MLACQVEVKSDNYDFLSHNSYVNCAQPFKAKFEHFKSEDFKYCGMLSDNDFALVRQCIVNSGSLTEEELKMFVLNLNFFISELSLIPSLYSL